jgi:hypothetical protein
MDAAVPSYQVSCAVLLHAACVPAHPSAAALLTMQRLLLLYVDWWESQLVPAAVSAADVAACWKAVLTGPTVCCCYHLALQEGENR